MNQSTHAWIAIRAIKLLEDDKSVSDLVKLLKPFAQKALIGAWIPDLTDAKLGGNKTQNHVFKIGPYTGPNELASRFVVNQETLFKFLGTQSHTKTFIKKYGSVLDNKWWIASYKASPAPGQHLANRAMSLSINNVDMLLLGDDDIQKLLRKKAMFIKGMDEEDKTRQGQIALFFFMLSHFIADSLMPCHCDERDLSDYGNGLHKELEGYWGKIVGTYFEDDNLSDKKLQPDEILEKAKSVDSGFGIEFMDDIADLQKKDIWEVVVLLCRTSFVIASIVAPYKKYSYKPGKQEKAPFKILFGDTNSGKLLDDLSEAVMHDAVYYVAIIWKSIWLKFK